ncbi:unnamed protein product, partial [Brachionus calyciflorus]
SYQMATNILPILFEKRWTTGNFKESNKFSEHDNYNLIQNYGEYLDSGYGKRYIEDKIHKSNKIFVSTEPFTKRDKSVLSNTSKTSDKSSNLNKRFPRSHQQKVICSNNVNTQYDLADYLIKKEKNKSVNSLTFESEIYKTAKYPRLVATEPYRQSWISPWRYSYKKRDYQTCTDEFRRVKSTCIDLSKF